MFLAPDARMLFPLATNKHASAGTATTARFKLFMSFGLPPPRSSWNQLPISFFPSRSHAHSSSPIDMLATTLRKNPLHQRRFGKGQSCRTVVIGAGVLGV